LALKLFVRDFDPQIDIADLENIFSEVGTVAKAVLTEREAKGVLRKVAYIEMSSAEEARDCIDRIHGMRVDGYTLTVTEDKIHIPDPNFSYKQPTHIPRAPKQKKELNTSLPNK
jgi:RNA recognition motif-containing protein